MLVRREWAKRARDVPRGRPTRGGFRGIALSMIHVELDHGLNPLRDPLATFPIWALGASVLLLGKLRKPAATTLSARGRVVSRGTPRAGAASGRTPSFENAS